MRLHFVTLSLSLLLTACASQPLGDLPQSRDDKRKEDFGKLFGPEFLVFGQSKNTQYGEVGPVGAMRANPHLWRATLDTLSFMPMSSADAVGGVIITDWYSAPSASYERTKLTVHIKDRQLRADAMHVHIHKERFVNGRWVAATVHPDTARKMEDIILSKARDLKIQHGKQ